MRNSIGVVVAFLLGIPPSALADTCPPPPSSVNPSVFASVSFDKKSGSYLYAYEVQNSKDSQIPLQSFALQIGQKPASIQSPTHWIPDFLNLPHMPAHFFWSSVPSRKWNSVDISPGKKLSGFGVRSARLPGVVRYNVEGETGVPSSSPPPPGAPDDEPMPNCPDWDFESPRFQTLVTGMTTGPLDPNTVSVAIRVRDEQGEHALGPMDPSSLSGKVGVLVLGSRSFDPGQIAASSIKFGPNGAPPLFAKLVPAGRENASSRDEHEEWEKASKDLDPDFDKNPRKQNLLLVFDQAALGVKCVLDKAIFLTGQTQSGSNVIGGVSSRFVGCDLRHPGKRSKKKAPGITDKYTSPARPDRPTSRS